MIERKKMAKKNFRHKKYTSRVGNITPKQIENLRQTALKNARPDDYKRIKFLKSAQFDKRIRSNIKENRVNKNVKALKEISRTIGNTKDRQKVALRLFGEIHTVNKQGKKVKRNTLTSKSQTERLAKITKKIQKGNFNIKKHVANTARFKEIKKHLPKGAGMADILSALDRTNFYFENKKTILQHNKNVLKHGKIAAVEMYAGKKLSQAYMNQLNDEDIEFLTEIDFL